MGGQRRDELALRLRVFALPRKSVSGADPLGHSLVCLWPLPPPPHHPAGVVPIATRPAASRPAATRPPPRARAV